MPRDEKWREDKRRRYQAIKAAGGTCYQASTSCGSDRGMSAMLSKLAGEPPPEPKMCERCELAPVHSAHGGCVLCLECAVAARSIRRLGAMPKNDGCAMSLQEIADELGCSDARVGQILDSAMAKLKAIAPTYLRELLDGFEH
jgi:hypothetical protein